MSLGLFSFLNIGTLNSSVLGVLYRPSVTEKIGEKCFSRSYKEVLHFHHHEDVEGEESKEEKHGAHDRHAQFEPQEDEAQGDDEQTGPEEPEMLCGEVMTRSDEDSGKNKETPITFNREILYLTIPIFHHLIPC